MSRVGPGSSVERTDDRRHGATRRRTERSDPAAGLGEADRALFCTLREWRAKRARQDGLPPYAILTNRELLDVLAKKPESVTALGHVAGIGPGKVERYGKEILARLNGRPRDPIEPRPEETGSPQESENSASAPVS